MTFGGVEGPRTSENESERVDRVLECRRERILGGPDGVKRWSERDAEDGVGDFDAEGAMSGALAGGVPRSADFAKAISKGGALSTDFPKLAELGDRESWEPRALE